MSCLSLVKIALPPTCGGSGAVQRATTVIYQLNRSQDVLNTEKLSDVKHRRNIFIIEMNRLLLFTIICNNLFIVLVSDSPVCKLLFFWVKPTGPIHSD